MGPELASSLVPLSFRDELRRVFPKSWERARGRKFLLPPLPLVPLPPAGEPGSGERGLSSSVNIF